MSCLSKHISTVTINNVCKEFLFLFIPNFTGKKFNIVVQLVVNSLKFMNRNMLTHCLKDVENKVPSAF